MSTRDEIVAELRTRLEAAMPGPFEPRDDKGVSERVQEIISAFAAELMDAPSDFDRIQVVTNEDPALLAAGKLSMTLTFPAAFNCQNCEHSVWGDQGGSPDLLLVCRKRPEILLREEDNDAMILTAFHCPWRSSIAEIEEK
jgi:hypothetical protein